MAIINVSIEIYLVRQNCPYFVDFSHLIAPVVDFSRLRSHSESYYIDDGWMVKMLIQKMFLSGWPPSLEVLCALVWPSLAVKMWLFTCHQESRSLFFLKLVCGEHRYQ